MARIHEVVRKDGSKSFWLRDTRDRVQVVIPAGDTREEAERRLRQYVLSRLETSKRYREIVDHIEG